MTTKLIVTIDTEEEGLWSDSFRATGNTVENVKGIPKFQALCQNHKVTPVYLINSPVAENDEASNILKQINERGACEIGCHIHPWNTTPVDENATSHRSYLCNLEQTEQVSKLTHVTNTITHRFGMRPKSFRAGRYGLDTFGAKVLSDLGYVVDSSVCPFTDYSADGGPDFRGYPWTPYYIGDALSEQNPKNTGLLEVPVSFGFNWVNFNNAFHLHEYLASQPVKKLRLRGILSRLNLLNKIKFSPEKHNPRELKSLANMYAKQHNPSLVMMFHSSSLMPGHSPYVRDKRGLHRFLDTIDEVFDFCLRSLTMESSTLGGFASTFRQRTNSRST